MPTEIPIRNVWLLFLYASGLAQFRERFDAEVEQSPDIKSLLARLLCKATENRLHRNLSFGYRARRETLTRVRGRIDLLKTEADNLLQKGKIACRYSELTVDTPRNRLVRVAHQRLASLQLDEGLANRCRKLEQSLERMGVGAELPTRAEIASEQFARHESDDRLLVSLANAVFNVVLPSETPGWRLIFSAQRHEVKKFSELFEKAVGNLFKVELPKDDGWRVFTSRRHKWQVDACSDSLSSYMPELKTDIIIENVATNRRIVVDTKFSKNIVTLSQFGKLIFNTNHLYQLYAYLRSQERFSDPMSISADGILLYPYSGLHIDETALVQGHRIRVVTVDLSRSSDKVVEQLRTIPILSSWKAPGH